MMKNDNNKSTQSGISPTSNGVIKGGYYQAPSTPVEQTQNSGVWGTAFPSTSQPSSGLTPQSSSPSGSPEK